MRERDGVGKGEGGEKDGVCKGEGRERDGVYKGEGEGERESRRESVCVRKSRER